MISRRRRSTFVFSVILLLGFSVVGIVLFARSQAATPFIGADSELGIINTPAVSVADTTASGGKAIRFAAPVSTAVTPNGPSGNWTLKFNDDFNGTALDTTNWSPMDGGNMNGVTTRASNVAVSGGNLLLTLASSSSGAEVCTCNTSKNYRLPVNGYAEARVYFPGDGSRIYNWPAWWVSGPNWPSAGEHDIAEVLGGQMTANYHSPSGSHNQGTVAGNWANAYHIYGVHRKASSADVYWDGKLVKSYGTDDNGVGEDLIVNVGAGQPAIYGTASQIKVDYVRAWQQ